jgi:hypothetical protein
MKPGTSLGDLTIQAMGIAHFSSEASLQKPRTVVNAVISKGINKALRDMLVVHYIDSGSEIHETRKGKNSIQP